MTKKKNEIPTYLKREIAEEFHNKALQFLDEGLLIDALEWIDKALELIPNQPKLLSEKNTILAHLKGKGKARDLKSLTQTLKQNKKITANKNKADPLNQLKEYKRVNLIANLIFIISFIIGLGSLAEPTLSRTVNYNIPMSLGSFIVGAAAHMILTIYIQIKFRELVKNDPRVTYNQGCVIIFFIIVVSFTVSMLLI